ncbi:hypothetical protein ACOMHN_022097 [Nucella lapillus]
MKEEDSNTEPPPDRKKKMWLPSIYVCVTMAMAILGNSLVLVVFLFRWHTSEAAKIYVLALACLDLVCALVSTPRELIPLWGNFTAHDRPMGDYCRFSIFFARLCDVASGFVLISIAFTRFLKFKDEGSEGLGVGGRWVRLRVIFARVMKMSRAMKSVEGAKAASAVSIGIASVLLCPVLIFSAPPSTAQDSSYEGYTGKCIACWQFADVKYKTQLKHYQSFLFMVFVAMVVIVAVIYTIIVRHIWAEKQNNTTTTTTTTPSLRNRRKSSTHAPRQSASLGALLISANNLPSQSLPLSRTTSEPDAHVQRTPKQAKKTLRSVSDGEMTVLSMKKEADGDEFAPLDASSSQTDNLNQAQKQSRKLDSTKPETNAGRANETSAYFPPVAYTAQQMSTFDLSMSQRIVEAEEMDICQRRPSMMSFQFRKRGHSSSEMTTLMFFYITVISVLSYVIYFIVIIAGVETDSGFLSLLGRSTLISNAANPVVYAICNPYFRSGLWKLLFCRREVI